MSAHAVAVVLIIVNVAMFIVNAAHLYSLTCLRRFYVNLINDWMATNGMSGKTEEELLATWRAWRAFTGKA